MRISVVCNRLTPDIDRVISKLSDYSLYEFEKDESLPSLAKINKSLENADVVLNMITRDDVSITISNEYPVDINKAQATLSLLAMIKIKNNLDILAKAVNHNSLIINSGEPVDIITSYLLKAHNLVTYGISRKADNMLKYLIEQGLVEDVGDYEMAGINDMLWLLNIKDKAGKDIYYLLREKVKGLNLNIKRHDLNRDSLRSLSFYGYIHSHSVPALSISEAVINFLDVINLKGGGKVYLNTVNNNLISELDYSAIVEVPCEINGNVISKTPVKLPLECVLAMTDYSSIVSVIAKALTVHSSEMYYRAIKLDPYLASILTLEELSRLSEHLINRSAYCRR